MHLPLLLLTLKLIIRHCWVITSFIMHRQSKPIVLMIIIFPFTVQLHILRVLHLFQYVLLNQQILTLLTVSILLQICLHSLCVTGAVEFHSQLQNNMIKCSELFLHFLVMTPALFSLPRADKGRHRLKYFITSSKVFMDKFFIVEL